MKTNLSITELGILLMILEYADNEKIDYCKHCHNRNSCPRTLQEINKCWNNEKFQSNFETLKSILINQYTALRKGL